MKFLFIVQGEGRGHMTQAIALAELLQKQGHEISAVAIGKSERRKIPDFVFEKIKAPIYLFESPNFITDKEGKSILLGKTIGYNLGRLPIFKKSLDQLHALFKQHKPDILINFYDILGGLYKFLYRPEAELWVIGHQYLIAHPDFPFAKSIGLEKLLFQANTKITSLGATMHLALSFRPLPPSKDPKLRILPPLLRPQLRELKPSPGDFILTYMVNPGYGEEVKAFAEKNPTLKIEAFWDNKAHPDTFQVLPNVVFHPVNDQLFLEKMAACRGLVSTAGFESIAEAMYLGKPVMAVPVQGQYEQACNALDAQISGAGIQKEKFDYTAFINYLNRHGDQHHPTTDWAESFNRLFLPLLDQMTKSKHQVTKEKPRFALPKLSLR